MAERIMAIIDTYCVPAWNKNTNGDYKFVFPFNVRNVDVEKDTVLKKDCPQKEDGWIDGYAISVDYSGGFAFADKITFDKIFKKVPQCDKILNISLDNETRDWNFIC